MLAATHPAQALMGSLLIQEELATRNRQMTFAVLAGDCLEWALEVRDVMEEIARDADQLADRVDLYASDGIFSPSEREQLLSAAREIGAEAREGVIL